MRIKNSINNLIFEILYKIIVLFTNIIIRRQLIKLIGIEIIGLTSVINQIITIYSIFELGISDVILYYLYKPIENNDQDKIIKLMTFLKKLYIRVCIFIIVVGLLLMPTLPLFIKEYTLSINYNIVYILLLLQSAVTYLFSYKLVLMRANQKEYKYKKIFIIVKIISFLFEIVCLSINYFLYLILHVISLLFTNYIASRYVDKNYPYLFKKDKLDNKDVIVIKKDIKNMFISKVASSITTSCDTIILSALSNVTILGLYSNYFIVFHTLYTNIYILFNSIQSSIGSSIVNKNNKEKESLYRNYSFLLFIISIYVSITFYILIDYVIKIWLGKEFILSNIIAILFTIQLFFMTYRSSLWQFILSNGMFKVDKIASYVGCIINVVLSIILYFYLGISGLIIGTILSEFIQYLIKKYYLSKKLETHFNNSLHFIIFTYLLILNIFLKDYLNIFILLIYNFILISVILVIIYKDTSEYNYLKNIIMKKHD